MEWRIHGVFDGHHGESVEELESVENFEPTERALTEGFNMSSETII